MRRYRRLALTAHPDKGGDAQTFRALQKALELLTLIDAEEEMDAARDEARERAAWSAKQRQRKTKSERNAEKVLGKVKRGERLLPHERDLLRNLQGSPARVETPQLLALEDAAPETGFFAVLRGAWEAAESAGRGAWALWVRLRRSEYEIYELFYSFLCVRD